MNGFRFNKLEKTIEISRSEVSVFEIYDAGRTWQAEQENMSTAIIVSASGTEELQGGVRTPITLTLENGWKIKASSNTTVTINRGNIRTSSSKNPFIQTVDAKIVIIKQPRF